MNRCHRFIWIALWLVVPYNAWAQTSAPDVKTVVVWGETAATSDPSADKRTAVSHARRNALEQVVGSYVTSETKVRNYQLVEDRIYSKATGFINSYRILQEKRDQIHRVQVEAKVSLVPVTEILRASGLLRKWRVGVVLAPIKDKFPLMLKYYSQVRLMEVISNIETAIGNKIVTSGFKLVDSRHVAKIRAQLKQSADIPDKMTAGIDILVTGEVSLATRSSAGNMRQAICQIHARALRADTGEIVYQGNIGNTFDGMTLLVNRDIAMKYATSLANGVLADGTPDLRTFGMGDTAALAKAISVASSLAADVIVSQITRVPAAAAATIALEIIGVEFSDSMDIEDVLKATDGVASVTPEEFSGGRQNIAVEYDGDAMALARILSRSSLIKKIGLKIKQVTKNKIVLAK